MHNVQIVVLSVDIHSQDTRVSRALRTCIFSRMFAQAVSMQETLGVPVISYADSNDFPAFYSRKSGFKVCPRVVDMITMLRMALQSPWKVDDPEAAARILCKDGICFRSAI